MANDKDSNRIDREQSRTWIEDGVLCVLYKSKLSLEIIVESETDSAELIKLNKISSIPVIIDLSKIGDNDFDTQISNLGKIVSSSHDVFHHESRIWIVGAKPTVRKISVLFSKMFLGGKIQFVESFKEAKSEALKYIGDSGSVLEV